MAKSKKTTLERTVDAVMMAKKKKVLLFDLYQNIQDGGEILSPEDLDVAIESLKLAQLDIKERERRRIQEKEAEWLKQKQEEETKRRELAKKRAERRAKRQHEKHVEQVTAMDLPLDFVNSFENDERADIEITSIPDALLMSLDTLGMVDIEYIASVTGQDMKTVIETLKGSIYQNPLHWNECFYKGWETADEYLSGNLTHKYELAKEANETYLGYFQENVKAIEERLNPDIDINDIYITLGSPWVPADVIDDFILHLIGLEKVGDEYPDAAKPFLESEYAVRHDEYTGLWEIPKKTRFRKSSDHGKYEEYNYSIWGTERMDMLYLMQHILNMKTIAIYDVPDPDKNERILNTNETIKILEKQDRMIDEFKHWVWQDEARKKRLQRAYCRKYGNIHRRVFDGSFLECPGMNPSITLRQHQKNAVARMLFTQNTLLAHDVGAGKTYSMIAAGMELRRLGKSKKNLYVIPNNILPQWANMFRTMYPDAKLLIVDRKNFNVNKRGKTLQRIIDEDFDAILMAYSSFDLLSLSKQYYTDLYKNRMLALEKANEQFASREVLLHKRAAVAKVLEKLQEDMSENVCEIAFDELGINTLFVDEAHNYKNVTLGTGISRVRGLTRKGSKKCDAMMDKVHCVQRQNNGGRVIMATGTPITNSITDIFILQKYLQDGELEFMGIQNFDSWVAMFGKKTTEFEIDVDTNSYHLATRFSKFCNVPELTSILSSVSDFYHIDQSMGIPDLEGYSDSVRIGSDDFKDYLHDISRRADDVRQKRVDPHEDNLLKITTDGRKAALDMRLIDLVYGLDADSKVFRCAENIMEIYEKTRDTKAIQMVFCDISTPKPGFNLYDELKNLLKAMGMPEQHIAYIHDAESEDTKRLLFHDLRKGNIAVIIGSTFKMGLGVNVQERLCALHHLDVPWRPADMVQREGRILRQGNTCDSVKIFRYITKGSFDAYSWQLLETKQKFISQILSGCVYEREGDDVDEAVLNYAEVKALSIGNPLIKRRVELINELDKYRILHREFVDEQEKKEKELARMPDLIAQKEQTILNIQDDIEYYDTNKIDYNSMKYKEQMQIRETIYNAVHSHRNMPFDKDALVYQGFRVVVPARMTFGKSENMTRERLPYVFLKRKGTYYLELDSKLGITKRLNNLLENLADTKAQHEKQLNELFFKKETLENELASHKETSYIDEIEALKTELDAVNESLGVIAA